MESGKQCMGSQNRRREAGGKKAAKNLHNFSQQMRQMQSQMQQQRRRSNRNASLSLAGNLVDLSKEQEASSTGPFGKTRATWRSSRIGSRRLPAASSIRSTSSPVKPPSSPPGKPARWGSFSDSLGEATDAFETGLRNNGSALGRRAQTSMDRLVEA